MSSRGVKWLVLAAVLAVVAIFLSLRLYAQPPALNPAPSPSTSLALASPSPLPTPADKPPATPTITATATPTLISVNTSTIVTIKADIAGREPVKDSVVLLRLMATGTPPSLLGHLKQTDDNNQQSGQHQDSNGNHDQQIETFSIQVPINETTAGQIQLQVSASFKLKGSPTTVLSNLMVVDVWHTFTTPSGFSVGIPAIGAISSTVISSTSSLEFTFPGANGGVPTIFVTMLPLPGDMDLGAWFVNQDSSNQELLDVSTYILTTSTDASALLQHVGSAPDDYTGGPFVDAYVLSPDRKTLLIIQYNNQESPLAANLGLRIADIDKMFDQFLSTIAFTH